MNEQIPFNLELDSSKNGVYLNQQQIDLLMIVNLADKNEIKNYIENICGQFPYKKAEDVIDIENLSVEECKRKLFSAYQDTLISYLDNVNMTNGELARVKFEKLGVPLEEQNIVIQYVEEGNIDKAYQYFNEKYGMEFITKLNRFMKDDFENIKSHTYEQIEELHNALLNDESIDTIIIATGKYDNTIYPTGNGVTFDPYLTTKSLIYCNSIGKHMRYHALFDYAHLKKLVSQGKTDLNHDEILAQMKSFVALSMEYINRQNFVMEDGKPIIETVEVFNELVEYNKPIDRREQYDMAWEKYFGITISEIMACFDEVIKPDGVSFMYNETLLEESGIRREKIEEVVDQIIAARPGFIDKFGDQMHLEDIHVRTERGKKELGESFDMLNRIKNKGLQLECTEFDLHINRSTATKIEEKKKMGEMSDEYVFCNKKGWIKEISDIAKEKGIEFERTTYWSLYDSVDHNLVRTNIAINNENKILRQNGMPEKPLLTTTYSGLYGDGKNLNNVKLNQNSVKTEQITKSKQLVKTSNNSYGGYADGEILSLLVGVILGIVLMMGFIFILNLV